MEFAKFEGNRLGIDGEIAENHAILVNLTASINVLLLNPNVVLNNFKETLLLLLTINIKYIHRNNIFFILMLNTVIDFLWACSNQQGPVQHKIGPVYNFGQGLLHCSVLYTL